MPAEDIKLTAKVNQSKPEVFQIRVTTKDYTHSPQRGTNQVNSGRNFKVTFTVEAGYHISSVTIDGIDLNDNELKKALANGYTFTNVTEDHTVVIASAPDEDTRYKVYHYKQSLEETEIEIDGKYYDIVTEKRSGTTGTLTTAATREYEGFTAGTVEQKIINGNGETIIEILYLRNSYTLTLVDCEGVTVEGGGTYMYGQTISIQGKLADGYEWVRWESSNTEVCANKDTAEYTFKMPAEDITLTAKAKEASVLEQPEPPSESQEKGFDKVVWLSIAGSMVVLDLVIAILVIIFLKRDKNKEQEDEY